MGSTVYQTIASFHFLLSLFTIVAADCECGYQVSSHGKTLLFTDAILTDFRNITDRKNLGDWEIKYTNISYNSSHPYYGRIVEDKNVVPNPLKRRRQKDAGLQLIVRKGVNKKKCVSFGQIQSKRDDILYGSFRASMKTTGTNGTCAASFFYYNDSQEIDMEILSREQNKSSHPINLSIQSKAAIHNNFSAQGTPGFLLPDLGEDPSSAFHEYRYDWSSEVISFFQDGGWLGDLDFEIPTTAGRVQINHWSNGDQAFTGGPPKKDAKITVACFSGYFNSSDERRVQEFENACGGRGGDKVCVV